MIRSLFGLLLVIIGLSMVETGIAAMAGAHVPFVVAVTYKVCGGILGAFIVLVWQRARRS